jgi:hypothetical protein
METMEMEYTEKVKRRPRLLRNSKILMAINSPIKKRRIGDTIHSQKTRTVMASQTMKKTRMVMVPEIPPRLLL